MFTGYEKTIPRATRGGIRKLASIYAQKYLDQLPKAGIQPWTGRSENILREQITNPILLSRKPLTYGIFVPTSLIALDRMPKHIVALKRERSITRWARTKLGKSSGFLTVKPHPWIQNANRNAGRFIQKHPRVEVQGAVARKGR